MSLNKLKKVEFKLIGISHFNRWLNEINDATRIKENDIITMSLEYKDDHYYSYIFYTDYLRLRSSREVPYYNKEEKVIGHTKFFKGSEILKYTLILPKLVFTYFETRMTEMNRVIKFEEFEKYFKISKDELNNYLEYLIKLEILIFDKEKEGYYFDFSKMNIIDEKILKRFPKN